MKLFKLQRLYVVAYDDEVIMNGGWERIWKEAFVSYFKLLSR
jgi:hypothetical protein